MESESELSRARRRDLSGLPLVRYTLHRDAKQARSWGYSAQDWLEDSLGIELPAREKMAIVAMVWGE